MIWTLSRIKNKTCQRAEELLVSQRPSISSAQLCQRTSTCSWVTFFFLEVDGRLRHSLGVVSLISVHALTEASDLTVKDAFYTVLESVVYQCHR